MRLFCEEESTLDWELLEARLFPVFFLGGPLCYKVTSLALSLKQLLFVVRTGSICCGLLFSTTSSNVLKLGPKAHVLSPVSFHCLLMGKHHYVPLWYMQGQLHVVCCTQTAHQKVLMSLYEKKKIDCSNKGTCYFYMTAAVSGIWHQEVVLLYLFLLFSFINKHISWVVNLE